MYDAFVVEKKISPSPPRHILMVPTPRAHCTVYAPPPRYIYAYTVGRRVGGRTGEVTTMGWQKKIVIIKTFFTHRTAYYIKYCLCVVATIIRRLLVVVLY